MAKRDNLCRIGVVWKGAQYDVLSIFRAVDSSIFVHTYSITTKHAIKSSSITQINDQISSPLNIEEFKTQPFSSQKVSFHKSGYIHSTDYRGGRIKMDEGIRGIPFEKIDTWAMLFTFYPMSPEKYRKRRGNVKSCLIIDIEAIGLVPYALTCYLVKHTFNFKKFTETNIILHGMFFRYEYYLPEYQLDLIVSCHSSSLKEFLPKGELMGYFTNFTVAQQK